MYICSPVGKFTSCIDAGSGTFSGTIQATTFYDGYVSMSLAQINRTAGFVELQYAGAGGVRLFGNTAYPITFACSTGVATFSSTITGTTIYGSTAVCSAVGLFSGCVGVGTPTPSFGLEVYSSAQTSITSNNTFGANLNVIFNRDNTGGTRNCFNLLADQNSAYIRTLNDYPINFITNNQNRLLISNTGIACFACQVCAPILSTCKPIQINGGITTTSATKQFDVNALGCSYICFNVETEFGVPSNTYIEVDLEAISYGGAGSSGMVYKAIAGGYSGHTIYAGPYHQYCEYVKSRSGMDLIICQGNSCHNLYGIQVYNCSSTYSLAGHLRIRVTTG